MSGQLVGEVIAASAVMQAHGLPERCFHALLAIAEKCHADTRRGTVPWTHIQDGLYGKSYETAKRAVTQLKAAGLLRGVKRGFNNQHGRVAAPVYEIVPLSEWVTQVTCSPADLAENRTGHSGDPIGGANGSKQGGRTGHSGDPLNGTTNGTTDYGTTTGPRASARRPDEKHDESAIEAMPSDADTGASEESETPAAGEETMKGTTISPEQSLLPGMLVPVPEPKLAQQKRRSVTAADAKPPGASRAERGTRLPDGWQPTRELIEAMRHECPEVNQRHEFRKFVDYWRGVPGAPRP